MASLAATQRQAQRQLTGARGPVTAGAIVRVAGLLGIAALAAFAFMVGLGALDAGLIGLGSVGSYLEGNAGLRVGVMGGAAGVGIVALALMLRRSSATGGSLSSRHIIAMSERGVVLVNTESVSTLAMLAVRQQAGVLGADVRVRGGGSAPVRLLVRAAVMPGTRLAVVGESSQAAAREAIERLAGLTVQDVHVEVQVAATSDLERVLE